MAYPRPSPAQPRQAGRKALTQGARRAALLIFRTDGVGEPGARYKVDTSRGSWRGAGTRSIDNCTILSKDTMGLACRQAMSISSKAMDVVMMEVDGAIRTIPVVIRRRQAIGPWPKILRGTWP